MRIELGTGIPHVFLYNNKLMSMPYSAGCSHTFEWYSGLDSCPSCSNVNIFPNIDLAKRILQFVQEHELIDSKYLPTGCPNTDSLKQNLSGFIHDNSGLGGVVIHVGGSPMPPPPEPSRFTAEPLRNLKYTLYCLFALGAAFIIAVIATEATNNNGGDPSSSSPKGTL